MKPPSLICVVTDRVRLSPGSSHADSLQRLVEFVSAAAAAGADFIQLRERDLEARELSALVVRSREGAQGRAKIIVNDRVDVAVTTGADGVHLRSDTVGPVSARRLAPPGFLIGRSVHGVAEAMEVSRRAVDYLILGTVFPTPSKSAEAPINGVETLAEVCASVRVPVFAIGGMTVDRARAAAAAGAAGVAAIGLFIPPSGMGFQRHLAETIDALRRSLTPG